MYSVCLLPRTAHCDIHAVKLTLKVTQRFMSYNLTSYFHTSSVLFSQLAGSGICSVCALVCVCVWQCVCVCVIFPTGFSSASLAYSCRVTPSSFSLLLPPKSHTSTFMCSIYRALWLVTLLQSHLQLAHCIEEKTKQNRNVKVCQTLVLIWCKTPLTLWLMRDLKD